MVETRATLRLWARGANQCCFAHAKFRRVAVRPNPQDAQYPFRLWYECLPQRRQRMWTVRFPILPSDAVPFVMPSASRGDVDHVDATDDREVHLPLRLPVQELLRVLHDDVHVRFESIEDLAVAASRLQLDEDVRIDGLVQKGQGLDHKVPVGNRGRYLKVCRKPSAFLCPM